MASSVSTCQQVQNFGRERDCTARCRSQTHAIQLISAIIKGSPDEIRAYCRYLCSNFALLVDKYGRTLLHIAASCGKLDTVSWLLDKCHCKIDSRDKESGWTATHRALFYGQLGAARILINHKANMKLCDHDGLLPIDLIIRDKSSLVEYRTSDPSEVYMWGSNSNFNLGLGNDLNFETPELLETFRRDNICTSKVILRKFHTVFLSNDGHIFTCGHGQGGSLGQNSESTVLTPKMVKNFGSLRVTAVSAGQNHMVVLTEGGQIWTCGLNSYHQLGHLTPPERLLSPRPISMKLLKGFQIIGCAAAKFHSVIYTKEAIFTFGLNAGQLGHPAGEKTQILPRQVSSLIDKNIQITHVEASDGATVCATNKGDVYVLHQYLCRKIASRQIELKKICVIGGHLDPKVDGAALQESGSLELKVLLLTNSGKLYFWREENPTLRRCIFAQKQQLIVSDICLNTFGFGLTSIDGTAGIGHFVQSKDNAQRDSPEKATGSSTNFGNRDSLIPKGGLDIMDKNFDSSPISLVPLLNHKDCEIVKVKRLPFIYRGTGISCDPKGRNYAVIQSHPKTCLYELPVLSSSIMDSDMTRFFSEMTLDDAFCDITIKVGNSMFPGHRFILASRCEYLRKLMSKLSTSHDKMVLHLERISADLFRHILDFIYTNTCIFLKEGHQFEDFCQNVVKKDKSAFQEPVSSENKKKKHKPVNPFQAILSSLVEKSKEFGLKVFADMLKCVTVTDGRVRLKSNISTPKMTFSREKFPEYYDICLRSDDKDEFLCHRCILTSRMSYFSSMLSSGWIETTLSKPISLPMPSKILSIIIDYLYEDTSLKLYESEDAEFLCKVLVAADQYLIPRLKEICEVAIVDLITLRNVCELLELSYIYNATQLKETCLQYICFNLAAILEMESLDILSAEAMDELSVAYQNMVTGMNKRRLTPYTTSPSFEELRQVALDFPEDGNEELEPVEVEGKSKSRKRTQIRRLSERMNEDKENLKLPVGEPLVEISSSQIPKSMPEPKQTSGVLISPKPTVHIPFDGKWNLGPAKCDIVPDLNSIMQAEARALETTKSSYPKLQIASFSKPPTSTSRLSTTATGAWAGGVHSPPGGISLSEFIKVSSPVPKELPPTKVNPWGLVPTSPLSPTKPEPIPVMEQILHEEQQIFQHTRTKSLNLIKIEEEAIQQLLIHYKAKNNPEENITVTRVAELRTPVPSWRKH